MITLCLRVLRHVILRPCYGCRMLCPCYVCFMLCSCYVCIMLCVHLYFFYSVYVKTAMEGEGPTRDLDQILATYRKRLRAPRSGAFTREFGLKSLAMLGVQGVDSYNKTGLERLLVARLKEVFSGRHKKASTRNTMKNSIFNKNESKSKVAKITKNMV